MWNVVVGSLAAGPCWSRWCVTLPGCWASVPGQSSQRVVLRGPGGSALALIRAATSASSEAQPSSVSTRASMSADEMEPSSPSSVVTSVPLVRATTLLSGRTPWFLYQANFVAHFVGRTDVGACQGAPSRSSYLSIVADREIRRAPAAIRCDQRAFVLEIDLFREKKVRDDHIGFRADRYALTGLVNEASLEEPSIHFDGRWCVEKVGEPPCRLRIRGA